MAISRLIGSDFAYQQFHGRNLSAQSLSEARPFTLLASFGIKIGVGAVQTAVTAQGVSMDKEQLEDSPREAQKANWLPAPDGHVNLTLCMYWPKGPIAFHPRRQRVPPAVMRAASWPQSTTISQIWLKPRCKVFADVNAAWLSKLLVAAGVVGLEHSEARARAIYSAVAGAQLFARGRSDISLFDSMIDNYRAAGLLPA